MSRRSVIDGSTGRADGVDEGFQVPRHRGEAGETLAGLHYSRGDHETAVGLLKFGIGDEPVEPP
ncbi:hypothetical protein [Streptomyces himastatinicus]|uniref:hypothetical protein n=1 Tax=Streptomyces himastatinicus TaxID=998084 RepID=UPI00142F313D|nr:hypothetical protein [Streptomyces himastatinicus]